MHTMESRYNFPLVRPRDTIWPFLPMARALPLLDTSILRVVSEFSRQQENRSEMLS
jgi:hypothetical protein